jgi:hypothetical protein
MVHNVPHVPVPERGPVSVSIPQPFVSQVTVAQPFRTRVEGVPDSYSFAVTDIPQIRTAVDALPVIRLSVENLPTVRFAVEPVEIRLTEIPSVRTHLPADFAVGFSFLGTEWGAIRLCGEAQIITEPYRPNPCEGCGGGYQVPGQIQLERDPDGSTSVKRPG